MPPSIQILGLRFLHGSAQEAAEQVSRTGGVMVVPAAPAMVRLQRDAIYRQAMVSADYAIPDSGLMVLTWKLLRGESLPRVSGLVYLETLFQRAEFAEAGRAFFVLPSAEAEKKLLIWSAHQHLRASLDDCQVAPQYGLAVEDAELLGRLEQRRPAHVVIAIGNGPQEKLGVYLRDHLSYRPAIHCIGAALGFLTGDQVAIPGWADRFYFGWLLRLISQPRVFIPRLTRAALLPWLILRYGREMPPLQKS